MLIFSPVPDEQVARRLADALRRWGAEPFVTRQPWGGRQQVLVGYYARNTLQASLLDDLLREAGIEGNAWRQASPHDAGQEQPASERLCVAFSTRVPQQAQALSGLLQEAGIESLATDQLAPSAPTGDSIQVLVRATDEAEALQVLERMPTQADDEQTPGGAAQTLIAWPQCPGCGTLRETCCPKCRTTGSQWQQADPRYLDPEMALNDGEERDTAEAGSDLLVICPTCDWLFAPRFYRRCAICSRDFGSGIEAEARAVSEAEAINPRVIAVVLALGILLLAVLAYFALLGGD